jgi:hypothetical protein
MTMQLIATGSISTMAGGGPNLIHNVHCGIRPRNRCLEGTNLHSRPVRAGHARCQLKAIRPSKTLAVLTPKQKEDRMKVHGNAALVPAGRLALCKRSSRE